MGIPKTSRKGKKAWRKNIDAAEVEEFLAEENYKAAREPAVQTLKDEDLFVVDKEADDTAVPAVLRKSAAAKSPNPLRSQLILDGLRDGITPIAPLIKRKIKGQGRPLPNSTIAAGAAAAAAAADAAAGAGRKRRRRQKEPVADLWADEPASSAKQLDWTVPVPPPALLKASKQQAVAPAAGGGGSSSSSSSRKRSKVAGGPIPAVEIDMPGCSFNPEEEAHQDAIAVAVAAEYKKQLKEELMPKAPAQFAAEGYKPGDELDELLVDAEVSDDEEGGAGRQQQQQQLPAAAAAADENEIALDEDSDEGTFADKTATAIASDEEAGVRYIGRLTAARKTQKDRNKEERRRQHEAQTAAKRALKQQRRHLDSLPELQRQLEAEEAEREAVRQRRQVVKEEKAAVQPPRLGKHKFEAPATAVLTSAEVTGSLRQLQPCFLVTADRFKSLQKRGLIEPRKPAGRKQAKRVEYVAGERREKAEERQREVADMAAARKRAKKVQQAGGGRGAGGGRAAKVAKPDVMLPDSW